MLVWLCLGLGLSIIATAAVLIVRMSNWFWPWLKGTGVLLLFVVGTLGMALGWQLSAWQTVVADEPLLTLTFHRQGSDAWRIVASRYGEISSSHSVSGELLEVGGRLLVVQGPLSGSATELWFRHSGLQGYRVGPDAAVEFEPDRSISEPPWFDLWSWDHYLPMPFLNAQSVYPAIMPTADGAIVDLILEGNQLVPLPANRAAEEAVTESGLE